MNGEYRVDADAPIDASDEELLALLRVCYETLDPMPPTLVDRTLHALAQHGSALDDQVFDDSTLDDPRDSGLAGLLSADFYRVDIDAIEVGLIRLAEQRSLEPVGARGGDAGMITFESDNLTVMIRISRQGDAVRLDGWLAPPGPDQVQLRTERDVMDASVDEEGRFVLDVAARGPVQLIVRHGAPQTAGWRETVLVPPIVL